MMTLLLGMRSIRRRLFRRVRLGMNSIAGHEKHLLAAVRRTHRDGATQRADEDQQQEQDDQQHQHVVHFLRHEKISRFASFESRNVHQHHERGPEKL